MKRASVIAFLIAAAISSVTWANQTEDLFQKALAAEQTGKVAERNRLLTEVLKVDPQHKLARWYSGQVLHNGKWQTLEKIERLVSHDQRWREYNDRVAEREDSLVAHGDLARWCRLQGLQLEEQWHWFNVLRHDPKNREALGALKLRPYQGSYFTAEQIAAAEAAEEQAKAEFKRYADLLKAAMREAERGNAAECAAALKKISNINDPAAIPAIVEIVLADAKNEKRILSKLGTEKGEKLLRQMQRAAIAALSEIPEHEATLTLVDVALYASDAQIRSEAAAFLKYREMTSFVPLLMAQLAAPIEFSVAVNTLPNGQITVLKDFYETGPLAQRRHVTSSDYLTQYVLKLTTNQPGIVRSRLFGSRGVAKIAGVWTNHMRDLQNASYDIADTEERVAAENAFREENNSRIHDVLAVVFEKETEDNPVVWWNAWKEYNELYTPEVLYETSERLDRTTQIVQEVQYGRTMSCFVAGTPVWTQAGMVPIEQIKVGDLVLSQDPHTGELNYRPVVDTTVRPPSATMKLGIGQETTVTTRGHRFWTIDKGWQMAKFLKAGQQLISVAGPLDLQSAGTGEDAEAFNLEIGQFHTYFVGKNRVLVHDNTCPQPTTNRLPGMPARKFLDGQIAMQN